MDIKKNERRWRPGRRYTKIEREVMWWLGHVERMKNKADVSG